MRLGQSLRSCLSSIIATISSPHFSQDTSRPVQYFFLCATSSLMTNMLPHCSHSTLRCAHSSVWCRSMSLARILTPHPLEHSPSRSWQILAWCSPMSSARTGIPHMSHSTLRVRHEVWSCSSFCDKRIVSPHSHTTGLLEQSLCSCTSISLALMLSPQNLHCSSLSGHSRSRCSCTSAPGSSFPHPLGHSWRREACSGFFFFFGRCGTTSQSRAVLSIPAVTSRPVVTLTSTELRASEWPSTVDMSSAEPGSQKARELLADSQNLLPCAATRSSP
mmetsp:Transcript_41148/g.100966  ORF Transcript_41148/g.100966 Transcript_41148/m.100966 type:complete len:275 (+) Transcript_41148:575-1399(+)